MVEAEVIRLVLDSLGVDVGASGAEILVNPSGNFVVGSPAMDSGLAGHKLIVDTYEGAARHSGGTLSGKDPSKVDRSVSYALRWVAKDIVATGLVKCCEIQISYAIGQAYSVSLSVETSDTGVVVDDRLKEAISTAFDLHPAVIIRNLDLMHPIFRFVTGYGHLGREELTWEKTDRMEQLQGFLK